MVFGIELNNRSLVSVVIPVYNAEPYLDEVLRVVLAQDYKRYEVIILYTYSRDRTEEICKKYNCRMIEIDPKEFHHGATRNSGVKIAKGDFVVFLTQDAIPKGEFWLGNLIKPLKEDENVAASYSRQLPKPDAYPWESRDIHAGGGVVQKVKKIDFSDPHQVKEYQKHLWEFIAFSNVSACYRKELLLKYPFNEKMAEVEDQAWCKRILELGYKVVFEPSSVVIHSHNETLRRLYKRQFIHGRCFRSFVNKSIGGFLSLLGKIFYDIALDYLFIFSIKETLWKKIILILKTPIFRFVKRYAFYRGFNYV